MKPVQTPGDRLWVRLVAAATIGVLGGVLFVAPSGSAQSPDLPPDALGTLWRVPAIDRYAPAIFDPGATDTRSHARYQIDATVLFPLFSIPIAHRDDVGFMTVVAGDVLRGSSPVLRTYELFAASFPERARGLNRMGFMREAVSRGRDGAQWTAHFGALSSSPETSRSEVALDSDESVRPYTVLDGFTNRSGATNRDTRVELRGSWLSSSLFYERLVPVWRRTEPERETRTGYSETPGLTEPLGFLGIVEKALETAALNVDNGVPFRRVRYPFVHKAAPMYLEARGHNVDSRRARRYVERGLVDPLATVHRLDFRILDEDGGRVQSFRVWTELPTRQARPASTPILPVGFVFKAKSFLELEGVRVPLTPAR